MARRGGIERSPGTTATDPPCGTPSGTLRETAALLVNDLLPDYTVQQYKDGMQYYQNEVAAPVSSPSERAKHTLPMFQTRATKVFADGVVEAHTAYQSEPFADVLACKGDANCRGETIWQPDALNKAFAALDKAGFQVHTHAIGDAAASETLAGLAHASAGNGRHDRRPGITRLQLVDPAGYRRFARLGVNAVPDPYWFLKDDNYTYLQLPHLGLPHADEEHPIESLVDNKVLVATASDYPVTIPPAPLAGIAVGVNRRMEGLVYEYPAPPSLEGVLWPDQRVTVAQMIRSFTINGARANYLEKTMGSIEVGKSADLVVLDKNLRQVEPAELFDAHVLFTIGRGQVLQDGL